MVTRWRASNSADGRYCDHQKIERLALRQLERRRAVMRQRHLRAEVAQMKLDELRDVAIVFDDEDAAGHGSR